MPEESVTQQESTQPSTERGKSTIDFPYLDLDNSVEIVKAVHKVEGDRCEWNQLATSLGVAPEGGGFRQRMLTAKTFGLLTYEKGQVMLTDCGIRMTDPAHEKRARFESFMFVPLFKQLFDRLNGQTMPPIAAVERAIENMGVAPKQKDKARQVFQRSAKQAGLFELSTDRLSIPPGLNQSQPKPPREEEIKNNRNGGSGDGGSGSGNGNSGQYHPFIQGLLQKLPEPDTEWPLEARKKWLATASNIFGLMYTQPNDQDKGFIDVEIKWL